MTMLPLPVVAVRIVCYLIYTVLRSFNSRFIENFVARKKIIKVQVKLYKIYKYNDKNCINIMIKYINIMIKTV